MRMGQFSRVSHEYGASLGVVKPPKNDFGKNYPTELDGLGLTEAQREELTQRIRDLFETYKGEREFY